MKNRLGHLIVVEGPDGVGKSTLTAALVRRLNQVGLPCHSDSFPGNQPGTLGSLVYRLHHEGLALGVRGVAPAALQAMHIAAHLDAIERTFWPKARAGENIILDRYWWSTAVYGTVSGIPHDVLDGLITAERRCWGALQPALVFLIDRPRPWRASEDTAVWHQLAHQYRELAIREQAHSRVEIVPNAADPNEVVTQMADLVIDMIGGALDATRPERPQVPQLNLGLSEATAPQSTPPTVSVGRIRGLKPTKVFDTYWRFAVERQEIFFRRLEGATAPWSTDPILQRHRFTNAYRASDRVSQFLIRKVLYAGDQEPDELFFRTIVFKLFNRIETWELLERTLGGIHAADFKPDQYERVLDSARLASQQIYSAAYIMPAAGGMQGHAKHAGHLRLVERMLRDDLPRRLADARSLRQAFELLRSYPMMGDFLALQYVIDLNYSPLLGFSEMEFVVAGPGAKSGIRKCFRDLAGLNEADIIRLVTESQDEEFARRDLTFRDLWGRPLQLIDSQNLFCEVDKYARAAHPDVSGHGGRTRIKRVFRPAGRPAKPWYPPKWRLNERIGHELENSSAPDRR